MRELIINLTYLLAAVLFILGLKRLSSPKTARKGNFTGATGMALAIIATMLDPEIIAWQWIIVGVVVGSIVGLLFAYRVKMTGMPQMVALLNGFGGAASALVASDEYVRFSSGITSPGYDVQTTIMLGLIVGSLTFSGSMIAWAKLQEVMTGKPILFAGQKVMNMLLLAGALVLAGYLVWAPANFGLYIVLAALGLIIGVLFVIPIGGADMPVIITLLNSYSGIAACLTGFVLSNNSLIITGALVGASGIILTKIMCDAMNRSLANVLFAGVGATAGGPAGAAGHGKLVKDISAEDTAILLAYARQVIFVPGYGMAVSQAQHQVRELADLLEQKGVQVKYAVHPVAGRMPGHMNVLLAEANVPYPQLVEMEEINPEFEQTDVSVVIGANDVVNPAARHDTASPIYGMPILDADKSKNVIVMKRSMNAGFAGIENELFYNDNTRMLFGDARKSLTTIIHELKQQ